LVLLILTPLTLPLFYEIGVAPITEFLFNIRHLVTPSGPLILLFFMLQKGTLGDNRFGSPPDYETALIMESDSGTSLRNASEKGYKEVVQALLNEEVEVNAKANNGDTALMLASTHGHKEIVRLLLDKGADVNTMNIYGLTALQTASTRGHKEVIELLIKAGAENSKPTNPNHSDWDD
jgi:hypothetical protein